MTIALPRDLEDRLVAAAHAAGARILDVYRREDRGVVMKPDGTPVTDADKASHELLLAALTDILPAPILSEEGHVPPHEERRAWRTLWCVDPLDGTKEFVKRSGEFTVNVGLIRDETPVAGVVHAPVTGTTYVGRVGSRAERRERDGGRTTLRAAGAPEGRPLRVVAREKASIAPDVDAFLARLPAHERVPSWSVLELLKVAEGAADLQLGFPLSHEWDTAAGHAILLAAGGQVLTLARGPLRYNKAEMRNPRFVACGGFDAVPFLPR